MLEQLRPEKLDSLGFLVIDPSQWAAAMSRTTTTLPGSPRQGSFVPGSFIEDHA